jgi:peptide/nickel transport system substrate-binding protein
MSQNYWMRKTGGRLSRRALIRSGGVAGVGLAGAALIGCGDDDPATTPTPGPGTPTPAPTDDDDAADDPFAGVTRGGTWQGDIAADPPTIDPYGNLSFLTKGAAGYAYSRLYKVGARPDVHPASALPEPDLAEDAETEDGLTWIVRLKQGAVFHNKAPVNGRAVTAEDVSFSFDRLVAEDSPQVDLARQAQWDTVDVIDDHTIQFNLSEVTATFLDDLADANKLWIMPPESDGGFDPRTEMIGSGPWIFEEYRADSLFDYSRNPDYFIEGLPFMDGARINIIPEYATRRSQFEAGSVFATVIQADDVLGLADSQPNVQWRGLQPALLSFIYFAPEESEPDGPWWQDERIRHAFSMAQDRAAIMDFAFNVSALREAGLDASEDWNNLIPAGWGPRWWVDPRSDEQGPSRQYFDHNIEEGRALIQAAGLEGYEFKYQTTLNAYGGAYNSIFEATEGMLRDIGVVPQVEAQDYSSVYITNTFRGDFQGVAFGYETPFPEVGGYFPRMFGTDPANHSRIRPDDINELARLQAQELDEEQRREYIAEIQRINGENMYYIPHQAGAGTGWTGYRPEVRGIRQTRGYGGATENLIHFWLDT